MSTIYQVVLVVIIKFLAIFTHDLIYQVALVVIIMFFAIYAHGL